MVDVIIEDPVIVEYNTVFALIVLPTILDAAMDETDILVLPVNVEYVIATAFTFRKLEFLEASILYVLYNIIMFIYHMPSNKVLLDH